MPKTPALNTISINPSLLSFKPRQVLLAVANPNPKPNMNKVSVPALNPEQKALLVRSVAGYLKSNGFSKTLKKFLSESNLEKDDFSDCSLDLEHMCCKYFDACDNDSMVSSKKVQDLQKDGNSKRVEDAEPVPDVQTVSKKKKKRGDDDGLTVFLQSEVSNKLTDSKEPEKEKSKEKRKSRKSSDSLSQEEEPDNKQKDKKKKKGKLNSESFVNNVEPLGTEDKQGTKAKESESARDSLVTETTTTNGNNTSLEDESVKVKVKKKKKDGSVSKTDCNKTSEEDTIDKERKGSKKRKRLASEENSAEPTDEKDVEESKRRRTDGSEELNISDDQVNGNLEKKEEKSAPNKIMKKQANGSAEPKTVKAFQRVKIDELVFTDERLKDNSYWAKDGSEIGYGAKAQEVLGQVRGRDFRHEKTKKKRGSYRGGLIDLQSHSVKFNYSDEE